MEKHDMWDESDEELIEDGTAYVSGQPSGDVPGQTPRLTQAEDQDLYPHIDEEDDEEEEIEEEDKETFDMSECEGEEEMVADKGLAPPPEQAGWDKPEIASAPAVLAEPMESQPTPGEPVHETKPSVTDMPAPAVKRVKTMGGKPFVAL
jgi:hypothetical protein